MFFNFLVIVGKYELLPFLNDNDAISLRRLSRKIYTFFKSTTYHVKKQMVIEKLEELVAILPHTQISNNIIIDNLYIVKNLFITTSFLCSNTTITKLRLESIKFNNVAFASLLSFLHSHSATLEVLMLVNLQLCSKELEEICNINITSLKKFTFSHNQPNTLSLETVGPISKLLIRNRNVLKTLEIRGVVIHHDEFTNILIPALSQAECLFSLGLIDVGLEDDMIPILCKMIIQHKILAELCVACNYYLSDQSIAMLCSSELRLTHLDISCLQFHTLTVDSLVKNNRLFSLQFQSLCNEQSIKIGRIIKENKSINTLGIGKISNYSEIEESQLIYALLFNSNIQTIFYDDNYVDETIEPYKEYKNSFLKQLAIIVAKNRQKK